MNTFERASTQSMRCPTIHRRGLPLGRALEFNWPAVGLKEDSMTPRLPGGGGTCSKQRAGVSGYGQLRVGSGSGRRGSVPRRLAVRALSPFPSMNPNLFLPVIFNSEQEARKACAERNQAGGFYRVQDLVKDPHPDFPGEIGFAVLWDDSEAATWRAAYLRSLMSTL